MSPSPDARIQEATAAPSDEGERLDAFLAKALDLSRSKAARLAEEGEVTLEGVAVRKSHRVSAGERFQVRVPPPPPSTAQAEAIPLDVVYEDPDLLVVNKAPGMVVHPAPGNYTGTLVNALLHRAGDLSEVGGGLRPGIIHRLDKDTSGLLIVAKTDEAHRALAGQLQRRAIKRRYLAAAWGHLGRDEVTVDAPIARDPANRQRMGVVEGGRRAVTHIRVRERWPGAELLDVALETGRTHQIRVHLAHLGHPVVGDDLYGAGWEKGIGGPNRGWARELARRVPRQFLHARSLEFRHPRTGETLSLEAPLPPDLEGAVAWVRAGLP